MTRRLSFAPFTAVAGLILSAAASLHGQPAQIQITSVDLAAGQVGAAGFLPVHMPYGVARPRLPGALGEIPLDVPAVPSPGFYPVDVTNPNNNPTLTTYASHDVIVNPIITAPGVYAQSPSGPTLANADTFMANLFASDMIHIVDQYTNPSSLRTVGQAGVITFNSTRTTYHDQDLQILVHAAGRVLGTAPGHAIHLFFRQGTDICSTFGGALVDEMCYSPDNPSTFYFCGYHDSWVFADIGRVVYSIEPYQNVPGCRVPAKNSPNGQAVDSMADTLLHETFEFISDPYPSSSTAWYNPFTGAEIADLCEGTVADIPLNAVPYRIQGIYSNKYHACSWGQ